MSLIQAVRDYFTDCPLLKDGAILNVDQLGADAVEYMLAPVPCQPILKRYTDGGTVRQFQFLFASQELYGQQVLKNLENSGFYEDLADWVESNSWKGVFPDLGDNRTVRALEILQNGTVYNADENFAQYQMLLCLKYYQNYRYLEN